MIHRAPLSVEFRLVLWHHCPPGVIMFLLCLARCYNCLFPLAGAVYSRMVTYPHAALVSMNLSLWEERQHKIVEWCVVVTTAIFMDKGSCHQKVRKRRSWRRLADPLSTIILKDAPYSLMSWQPERTDSICHSDITLCSSGQGTTSGPTLYPKRVRR